MRYWLKEMRIKSNSLTQKQLANMVGISRTMITEIENGKANPSVEVAKKIARVLGFNWARFYENEQSDSKETGQNQSA